MHSIHVFNTSIRCKILDSSYQTYGYMPGWTKQYGVAFEELNKLRNLLIIRLVSNDKNNEKKDLY